MSLYTEFITAVQAEAQRVWAFPAPVDIDQDPYITFMRKRNQQDYDLNGSRGLNEVPISVVAWSRDLQTATNLGDTLIGLLEPYTSTTVRKVRISSKELMFEPKTETHGLRVMATFITTEE